jgi:hypothetical protein
MTSITSKFLGAFDTENKDHVQWLAHMIDIAETMADPSAKIALVKEINANPMKVVLDQRDALDWPHIHFVLCAAYAKAVLKGRAVVPRLSV